MSWRDALVPGKFRGVPFAMRAHAAAVGRRVQVHEFPLRNAPFAEDLGRQTRGIALDAFVLGEDYMARRDRMLRALEQDGSGQLVHPYLGEMRVTVTRCVMRESTAEGGMATFELEFVEAGNDRLFDDRATSGAAVAAAANATQASAQASMVRRFSVANRPAFVAAGGASVITQALDGHRAAVAKVRGVPNAIARLQKSVEGYKRDLITLMYEPAQAAQALVSSTVMLVREVANAPRDALNLARLFFRFGVDLDAVLPSTTSRTAQARNQAEVVQLVRAAAVAEGARAATGVNWESYQDAVAARDELLDVVDELMVAASTDELYDALRGLRVAVARDVGQRGADLARLVQWTPPATLPALVAAQRLYADARRADELLQRNGLRHPLFVAGAQPLEVLSDVA
jgi:prophage DNA circulation protein